MRQNVDGSTPGSGVFAQAEKTDVMSCGKLWLDRVRFPALVINLKNDENNKNAYFDTFA